MNFVGYTLRYTQDTAKYNSRDLPPTYKRPPPKPLPVSLNSVMVYMYISYHLCLWYILYNNSIYTRTMLVLGP